MTEKSQKTENRRWTMDKKTWDNLRPGNLIGLKESGIKFFITVLAKEGGRLVLSHPYVKGGLASAAGIFEYARGYGLVIGENGKVYSHFSNGEITSINSLEGKEASGEYLKRKKSSLRISEEEFDSLSENTKEQADLVWKIMIDNTLPTNFEKMSAIAAAIFGEGQCSREQIAALGWFASYYEHKLNKLRRQTMPMGMTPESLLGLALMARTSE